jgi:hypothetical protein
MSSLPVRLEFSILDLSPRADRDLSPIPPGKGATHVECTSLGGQLRQYQRYINIDVLGSEDTRKGNERIVRNVQAIAIRTGQKNLTSVVGGRGGRRSKCDCGISTGRRGSQSRNSSSDSNEKKKKAGSQLRQQGKNQNKSESEIQR